MDNFRKHNTYRWLLTILMAYYPLIDAAAQSGFTVSVEGKAAKVMMLEDFKRFKLVELPVFDKSQKEVIYEGVLLQDLLEETEVPFGDKLRGTNLSQYVEIIASDGYKVVFSLSELDPQFGNNGAIVAIKKDGQLLNTDEGPFRMVVPGDKRPARWVRNVTKIRVEKNN